MAGSLQINFFILQKPTFQILKRRCRNHINYSIFIATHHQATLPFESPKYIYSTFQTKVSI
jgi:hypothetical protein